MRCFHFALLVLVVIVLAAATASLQAQQPTAPAPAATATPPAPPPYGTPINLETALKALTGAKAEADANSWPVCIVVVDTGGHLVALHRLDNTQIGSIEVATQKAKTAALFRRPTKVFEDLVAGGGGGLRILKLPGALPIEGGIPIVVDGKLIGAIGVSGVTSQQDAQIASAGIAALSK